MEKWKNMNLHQMAGFRNVISLSVRVETWVDTQRFVVKFYILAGKAWCINSLNNVLFEAGCKSVNSAWCLFWKIPRIIFIAVVRTQASNIKEGKFLIKNNNTDVSRKNRYDN